MKKHLLTPLISLLFIACGGGGGSSSDTSTNLVNTETVTTDSSGSSIATTSDNSSATTSTPSTSASNLKLALNNTGSTVEELFNGYTLKIISSVTLEELKETSQGTIAVYGTVNGDATQSLLKINTNYINSTISVAVFEDEALVAQSETFTVSNEDAINFGEITIN